MKPTRSMVNGTLDADTRAAARKELDGPERDAALDEAFALPDAPEVFDAAFQTVHPTPRRGRWWALALFAAVLALGVWRLAPAADTRIKAGGEAVAPEATLVVLVAEGTQVRRVLAGEVLSPEARLLFRVASAADGYVALEVRRGGGWTREWPSAPSGAPLRRGEVELGDSEGAAAVRVGEGPLEVRLVTAAGPLDVASTVTLGPAWRLGKQP